MNKLLSYAIDFVSFLLERTDNKKIDKIILFGSVSREEAGKESDVDLFIETKNKEIEKLAKKAKDDFFNSIKFKDYWKLKGIANDIKITVGKLKEWKELKNSIISNGILLYGKYEEMPENAIHKTIISWEEIKPESKRVLLFKRLFGYSAGKKRYAGLLQQYEGEKIGKGSIIVPTKNSLTFTKLFKEMKITIKIRKIVEYS